MAHVVLVLTCVRLEGVVKERNESPRGFVVACDCNTDELGAIHAYLKEHFPQCVFHDFHAPTRLEQADLPSPQGEHHVVKVVSSQDALPHYVIFLKEFFGSPDVLLDRLRRWNVEEVVRGNLVAVISRDGASPL